MALKAGDVVQLNTGEGPLMTYTGKKDNEGRAVCQWFDDCAVLQESLAEEQLSVITPQEGTEKFSAGDVVQLNSGGKKMSYSGTNNPQGRLICNWFCGHKKTEGAFVDATLHKVGGTKAEEPKAKSKS